MELLLSPATTLWNFPSSNDFYIVLHIGSFTSLRASFLKIASDGPPRDTCKLNDHFWKENCLIWFKGPESAVRWRIFPQFQMHSDHFILNTCEQLDFLEWRPARDDMP
jgi:hypothetical protein